jgi:hypothetical protein
MEPKCMEKHHMYGYRYFSHLKLVYIDHNPCLELTNMRWCNAHHCFGVPCSYLTHRPSFATVDEWSQMTGEAPHVWVPVFFSLVAALY